MKIDAWTHMLPKPCLDHLGTQSEGAAGRMSHFLAANPALYDLDLRLRTMDRFSDYVQVLTPTPLSQIVASLGGPAAGANLIRLANDSLAEVVARHRDRFVGFAAALPMADPGPALAEIDRVIGLGALGVQIETDVQGAPLDDERFEGFWAKMAALGRPVWIHPFRAPAMPDYPGERTSKYGLWQVFGWPYDTAIAMSRLIFSGLLERHPGLRVITHHGGGMVPHFSGRLGPLQEHLGRQNFDETLTQALQAPHKPLLDSYRMFYADTALYGAKHAVRSVVEFFGAGHVLFGTDMPFDPEQGPGFIRDTITDVDALPVDGDARRQIYEGNARRVLGIPA